MIIDLCALICFPDGDLALTTALKEKLSILTYAVLWSLSKLLPLALLLIVNAIGSCLPSEDINAKVNAEHLTNCWSQEQFQILSLYGKK